MSEKQEVEKQEKMAKNIASNIFQQIDFLLFFYQSQEISERM